MIKHLNFNNSKSEKFGVYLISAMKRALSILLCFCYISVAFGFTVHSHYCGGKLKSIALSKISEEGCCGSAEESAGCCSDKEDSFKLKEDHRNSPSLAVVPFDFCFNIIETVLYRDLPELINLFSIDNYHAPPVFYDNPIYLKNQVFLI